MMPYADARHHCSSQGTQTSGTSQAAIAELVGADEADLWPDAGGLLAARTRPEELETVYPHRWAVPREAWVQLFESAENEIAILAYSALFLAEDARHPPHPRR
jgi:hypothetical protein